MQAPQLLSGTSMKGSGAGKSSQWAELQAVRLAVHFAWEEWPHVLVYMIHGLCPRVWLDGQGAGRNMIGKRVTRESEEEVTQTDLSEWAKKKKKKT